MIKHILYYEVVVLIAREGRDMKIKYTFKCGDLECVEYFDIEIFQEYRQVYKCIGEFAWKGLEYD